ncbi:MAG: hypothetical protein PCFJNLEI_02434 [Verrucomicrobiae bacterium]|nr:hypothetical protein [Verrucomicrobiae bacterium]
MRRNSSFTLIELLMVVAVIAVLAALLMPALKSSRDRAKTVECASNERQIGVAFAAFLVDRNGFYPYSGPPRMMEYNGTNWTPGFNSSRGWVRQIAVYLSPEDVSAVSLPPETPYISTSSATLRRLMQCRANPWPFPKNSTASWWIPAGETPRSYQMNNTMFPVHMFIQGGNYPTMYVPDNWLSRVQVNSIRSPARLALLGEIPWTESANNAFGHRLPGPPHDTYSHWTGFTRWTWTTLAVTGANVYATWKRPDCGNFGSVFHNLGANILFVDGHVEWHSKKTLITYGDQYETSRFNPAGLPGNVFWTDNQLVVDSVPAIRQFPAAPWPWDP